MASVTYNLLRELVLEALCELQDKKDLPPRIDSTSRVRRDHPDYENERMKKAKTFPGYDEMKSLSLGIAEDNDDEGTNQAVKVKAKVDAKPVKIDALYLRSIIRQELQAALQGIKRPSKCNTEDLLRFMNRYSAAEKGKLK